MIAVLREHRRAQLGERLRAGSEWIGDGTLIFCRKTGDMLHPDTPSALVPKLCKAVRC